MSDPLDSEKEFEKTIEVVRRRQKQLRRPRNAANVVAQVLTRRSVAATKTDEQLIEIWEQSVGEPFASQTRPGMIRRGVLEVFVTNSSVHQQLAFNKKYILQKIKKFELLKNLKDIRFKIGSV